MGKYDFSGKKVLVTGGSRGIGREVVQKMYEFGAQVIVLSKSPENLKKLLNDFGNNDNKRIKIVEIDLCKVEQHKLKQAIDPFLPVDYLVNNAGINILESFLDMKPDSFEKIFNVNFKSALFLTQHVARSMVNNGMKGSIVNISSQASYCPLNDHMAYSISKSALDAFTRLAAWELGPKGIRVNGVNPTVVMTELGRRDWPVDAPKSKALLEKMPLGKFAEVDDVVNAVLFLLSDESRMITGVNLPVDGGVSVS